MATVDLELKKAFSELQEKKIDTEQKLRISNIKIDALKKSKQRSALTLKEISKLPSDTQTYESVGRIFVLTPRVQVLENLNKQQKNSDEKIKTLEHQMNYLENSLKNATNSLRELVLLKKA